MACDDEVDKHLQAEGWTVLRFWDVDIDKRLEECARVEQGAILWYGYHRIKEEVTNMVLQIVIY